MDINKLQATVIDALEDVKAQDIALFDTTHLTALFDRLAIASGTSNRQTKALAASVRDKVKQAGGQVVSIEGEDTGEWVLVDLGDMIVHIMQPAIRAYYRLEEIWGDRAVGIADAKRGGKAASKTGRKTTSKLEEAAPAKPRAPRKTASKSAAVDGEAKPARKTAAKTATKTATKTAAKSAVKSASKTAGKTASKTSARKVPVGATVKVGAKSAGTKKAAPKRATAAR